MPTVPGRYTVTTRNNRTIGLKSALKFGVGMSAMFAAFTAPAFAQDASEADEPVATETATEDTARRLNTIKVEATRREGVTVQDVPVAVTAFDAQLLSESNFDRIEDLEQLAPSVGLTQTESSASGTSISIRGIGTGSNNPGFEPAVGVVIDGVFRTRTGVALAELPELQSVEVLRGPQGTLFGRNTSSGVVSINTKKPQQEAERVASLQILNFDGVTAGFSATGGISDNWSARIDTKYRERDGYIDDVNSDRSFNDIKRFMVKGQLLYEGVDNELRLIADYAETDEQCCLAVILDQGTTGPAVTAGAGAIQGVSGFALDSSGALADPFERQVAVSPNRDYNDSVDEWGVSAQYDHDFENFKFTSITAYRDWQAFRNQDIDFTGIDRAYREDYEIGDQVFTQELRFNGQAGPVDWLVGGFYMNEKLDLFDPIRFGVGGAFYTDALYNGATAGLPGAPNGLQVHGTLAPATVIPSFLALVDPSLAGTFIPGPAPGDGSENTFNVETNALAVFTHNEIELSDNMMLTVGLRYNHETKDLDETFEANVDGCDFLADQTLIAPGVTLGAASIQALGAIAGAVCNPIVNNANNGTITDDRTDEEITGTVKLAYDVTDDVMVYGSYSRGFKSGGYNLDASAFDGVQFGGDGPQASDQEFDKEVVDAFELGWKTSFGDGLYTLNGAVFFQEVEGFQLNVFTGVNFRTVNVGVESQGVELEFGANPVEGLLLQLGATYTDASYTEDALVPDGTGGFRAAVAEGVQLSNVPEFVITGSGTYTVPLGSGLEGFVHGNFRYNDEVFTNDGPGLQALGITDNDAYAIVGGRIGVVGNDGQWEVSLFGENLTDEEFFLSSFPVPEQTSIAGYPSTPRFYGVEGKVRF